MTWRGRVALVVAACIALGPGCVDTAIDSPSPSGDPAAPHGWSSAHQVQLSRSGLWGVPYLANSSVPTELTLSLDGGSWRGVMLYTMLEGSEIQFFDDFFPRWEYASSVRESRLTGSYSIECLAHRNGSFCELYNNTSEPIIDHSTLYEERVFGETPPLPAGRGYLVIEAEFNRLFELKIGLGDEIWMGEPRLIGQHARIVPEMFRGEYVNMSRCIWIAWCGTIEGGGLVFSGHGAGLVYVDQTGTVSAGVTTFEFCIQADRHDPKCAIPQPSPSGRARIDLEAQWHAASEIRFTLNVTGPPTLAYGRGENQYWMVGGGILWITLPEHHPGPAST